MGKLNPHNNNLIISVIHTIHTGFKVRYAQMLLANVSLIAQSAYLFRNL